MCSNIDVGPYFAWPESWNSECGSKLIYETLPGKEFMYVLPITSILGRLPVVRAGDMGITPFSYRNSCRMAPIVTTTTLQRLTPGQGLLMAVPCTLSIPGRWAGPAIRASEIEMKWRHYYILLRITIYLLIRLIKKEIYCCFPSHLRQYPLHFCFSC